MQDAALPGLNDSVPAFVDISELLAVLNALVEFSERFTLVGEVPQPRQHGCRIFFFGVVRFIAGSCRNRAIGWHRLVAGNLLERVVLAPQFRRVIISLLALCIDLALPSAQGKPRADLCAHRRRAPGWRDFRWLRGLVLRLLMFLERALDRGVLVATLAGQVLLCVLEFILIESELRLRQFQAIVVRALSRLVLSQLGDVCLLQRHALLELGDAVRERLQRSASGWRAGGGGFP